MKQQFKTPGELIREDLHRLGWSQQDLSDALGIDRSVTSKLINDKMAVTVTRARDLGKVTGRKPWEYFKAQAYLWFASNVNGHALAKAKGRKKEGEK